MKRVRIERTPHQKQDNFAILSFRDDKWNSRLDGVPSTRVELISTTRSLADEMDAVLYMVSTAAENEAAA